MVCPTPHSSQGLYLLLGMQGLLPQGLWEVSGRAVLHLCTASSHRLPGPWKAPRMAALGLRFLSGQGEGSGRASLALAQKQLLKRSRHPSLTALGSLPHQSVSLSLTH